MRAPEAYLAEILSCVEPLPAVELPLAQAHGLVLARDHAAGLPVPPWTNAAMDGYAVDSRSTAGAKAAPVILPVAGDIPAGAVPGTLPAGAAMRIMTGAMLPDGADAVVKVEDTDQAAGPAPVPDRVEIRVRAAAGLNVRRAGEDVRPGDPVLPAGAVLDATALAALASVGAASVTVVPRARVAVISTGAELVAPGQPLPTGSIPDSNSLLLSGLVVEHGATASVVAGAGDDADSLEEAVRRAASDADLVVTSGGVSAGAYDPLTMLGQRQTSPVELSFATIAMQPGKPQGHGTVRADDGRLVPLIALPGNPVSALVSFRTIVAPALARLMGHGDRPPASGPAPVRARAAVPWPGAGNRRQYMPVRFVDAPQEGAADEPGAWVAPSHRLGSGSHLVASLPAAQALAVVAPGCPGVEVGDEVDLLALTRPAGPAAGPSPQPPIAGSRQPAPGPTGQTHGEAPVRLTHLDRAGAARMVDVTDKEPTVRTARARAFVDCSARVVAALRTGSVPKGDVMAVARIAGIAAAKKVPELLPLAHTIGVHGCTVDVTLTDDGVRIDTRVRTADRTGVEMEALTAATVAALAIVDMVKGVDRSARLRRAEITAKSGGRSGEWVRPASELP